MGIKIFYLVAIIYSVLSSLGIVQYSLGAPYWYIFGIALILYQFFYWQKEKVRLINTIFNLMLANIAIQLTGGINSPLFYIYIIIFALIGYRESVWHYLLSGTAIFGMELLAALFKHSLNAPPFIIFALSLIVYYLIFQKVRDNAAFLKRSLIKFEAQSSFLAPAAFEKKAIVTEDKIIDSHGAVERPLLFLVKFIHRIFEANSTVLYAYHSDHLTMIYGVSESELFRMSKVIESSSGIYHQVINKGR